MQDDPKTRCILIVTEGSKDPNHDSKFGRQEIIIENWTGIALISKLMHCEWTALGKISLWSVAFAVL